VAALAELVVAETVVLLKVVSVQQEQQTPVAVVEVQQQRVAQEL